MDYLIEKRVIPEQPVIVGRRRAPRTGIPPVLGEVLASVFQHARKHNIAVTGPPFVRYLDPNPEMMTFEPGMPIALAIDAVIGSEARRDAGLTLDALPGGQVVATIHTGPYDALHEAYAAIEQWIGDRGLTMAGAPWESYLTDPSTVPDPADWKTEVVWPVAAH